MVTHIPVLGVAFGTFLLAVGLIRGNRSVQQAGLVVLVLAGLAAGVAYLTGEGAEEAVEGALSGGKPYLEPHEEAAMLGLVAAGLAGAVALVALLSGRKGRNFAKGLLLLNLLVALTASGMLTWVANLGGRIGHPEIRSGQTASLQEDAERHDSR